ncbi:MAG: hypothetical protein IJ048_12325, partial [Clostridia bacterium]|nr:hypothetical protein [Clostridia bacterium]
SYKQLNQFVSTLIECFGVYISVDTYGNVSTEIRLININYIIDNRMNYYPIANPMAPINANSSPGIGDANAIATRIPATISCHPSSRE